MAWSAELRRRFPTLPAIPDGITDEEWAAFVAVWNGDTLKVAAEKCGIGYNRLSRALWRVRARLTPPRKE